MEILASRRQSQQINELCDCTSLDREVLRQTFRDQPDHRAFDDLPATHPHLFADTPVYLCRDDLEQMERLVAATERLAALPSYRARVAAAAPVVAHRDFGPRGALMGYDFHLAPDGPRLIEINTNAGGAFLNAAACEAQRACCAAMASYGEIACPEDLSARLAAMFVDEWRLQRGAGSPHLIAIVDDRPDAQYLYPEFLLAKATLEAHGLPAVIADPQELEHRDGTLWLGDRAVDLVYNRLVDFNLVAPEHDALSSAYAEGDVVVTPNPFVHALLADKRNLIAMSNAETLAELGVSRDDLAAFVAVPRTRLVEPETADQLWADRDGLFFKPVAGHGGKAVYRGDKLTRRVWGEIVAGNYVAQQRVAPTERLVAGPTERARHKFDVRLYTYAGKTLLAAARLYQGQTTNFRTPGGGFAPVMIV